MNASARCIAWVGGEPSRRLTVAQLLVDVGKSLHAFEFKGRQYLSHPIDEAMKEAEAAFAADDYDLAEHLAKVVACMVRREAPKFAANPKARIERLQGLQP
jgi:hypothetical protein